MHHLPVDDRAQAAVRAEDEIPRSHVAVHDARRLCGVRNVVAQPAQGKVDLRFLEDWRRCIHRLQTREVVLESRANPLGLFDCL